MKAHYAEVHKRLYDGPQREKEKPRYVDGKLIWKGVSVETVITLVAKFYKVSEIDIREGKVSALVRVRYTTMYLAYYTAKKTMRHVGRIMGFHLNTVCEGIRKIGDRRLHDAILNGEINALRAQIEELGKHVISS